MNGCARELHSAIITGPTGALGTALCRCLIERKVTVYAVCRPDSPRISALPVSERLHVIPCDGRNLSGLPKEIPDGADAFFHFAWAHTIGSGRNDMPAQIDNIRWTIDAVRAAASMGCRVFIGAGTQAEYGRPNVPLRPDTPCFPENGYGMAKLCAGEMSRTECQRLGLEHIWIRIISTYGPGDGAASLISTAIRKLLAGECPELTPGEQMWDYLYTADAAEAFYLAAVCGRNGAIYPLGSGRVYPLRQYVETLRDAIDPNLPLGFGKLAYPPLQVMFLQADISAIRNDTGFEPHTGFEQGIRLTVESVKGSRYAGQET